MLLYGFDCAAQSFMKLHLFGQVQYVMNFRTFFVVFSKCEVSLHNNDSSLRHTAKSFPILMLMFCFPNALLCIIETACDRGDIKGRKSSNGQIRKSAGFSD